MLRLTKYARYRHKSCLDVDLIILSIRYVGPKYTKVKVAYVLQRNPDFILDVGEAKIRREHLPLWTRVA